MQTRIENGMSINVYTPKITKAMVLVFRSKPRFQLMLPTNGWREIAELNEFKYTDEIDCWVMHKKGDENGNLSLLIQKVTKLNESSSSTINQSSSTAYFVV
ncbi:hypothetical protein Q3G72_019785 [Acer saccharum]|nr:hypothetical protein Q3G72_019785 [Acer saccharum]